MRTSLKLVFIALFYLFGFATVKSQEVFSVSNAQLKLLPVMQIKNSHQKTPKSYLHTIKQDSLVTLSRVTQASDLIQMYTYSSIPIKRLQHIVITNRKAKLRNSLIGCVVGGTAGFFLGKEIFGKPRKNEIRQLLGQESNPTGAGIAGATLGLGFGLLIGSSTGERHFKFTKDQEKELERLKKFVNP